MRLVLLSISTLGLISIGDMPARSELRRLANDAITPVIAGATLHIDTPLSSKIVVQYAENGQLAGDAGSLAFHLGSKNDRGRWWIANDKLCHKWRKWFDAEEQCLALRLDDPRIHWRRDDGTTGTATIVARAPPRPEPSPIDVAAARPTSELTATGNRPAIVQRSPPAAPERREVQERPVTTADPSNEPSRPVSMARLSPTVSSAPLPRHESLAPPAGPRLGEATLMARPEQYRVAGLQSADMLNMRNGPATTYPVIAGISQDARGIVVLGSCVLGWCQIRHDQQIGWVNGSYLLSEQTGDRASTGVATGGRLDAAPRLVARPRLVSEGILNHH